jgi:hypothetical protein
MKLSPLSPAMLPATIATWSAFAPPVAAVWARRDLLREPAGQVATCWAIMALAGITEFVGYFYLNRNLPPVTLSVTVLFPLLLLPPTIDWIGGGMPRWRWPIIVAWSLVWSAAVAALHQTRVFGVVINPLMAALMAAMSAWALASQIRRAPNHLRTDWFWILLAHVLYFVVMIFRVPLIESLVARHPDLLLPVDHAFQLLHCVVYALLARGMLLRSTSAVSPRPLSATLPA